MPIDTSIYSNIQQPRQDGQLNALAQMAQLQQAQNTNKLFDLSFAEKQRDVGADNALAGMLTKGAKPEDITQGLASQGYGAKALAYQKMLQERQKAEAELKGANLGNDTKQYELDQKKRIASIQSNAALLTDPNFSYEKFVQHVQQAVDRGETKPEQALQFIQQAPQDPAQLKAMLTQHLIQSLAPEKQLEAIQPKVEMKDTGGALTGIQMNPNLPGYGQPVQGRQVAKTQSPDSAASNATTRRGQDLTDARSKEEIAIRKAELANKPGTEAAKVSDARDVLQLLDQAEPLLNKSTSSYAGQGVDMAARAVGKSTPGAQAAAQLKALEGALISKMPKMSGPQSDKDVLLYRQMAGQIGDPTIPADTKRAAMATIREINQRNAKGAAPQAAPSQGIKFLGFE